MSSIRKITTNEIQAVGAILQDKEAIELLKKINDNIVTEEDTKGKRKQNDIFQFVGFAHDDDVLGTEDKESEEYQQKKGTLKKLVDAGLLLEGFHIPLERASEKKYGDVKVSSQERVGKYKLTEEGLTVLALVTRGNNNNNNSQEDYIPCYTIDNKQEQDIDPDTVNPKTGSIEEGIAKPTTTTTTKTKNNKSKAVAEFKKDIKEENKL